MDERAWDTVDRLVDWLDTSSSLPPETERLLRVMKLSEEVGETTQAITGVLGQNPRKGVTHTWQDVEHELCDVFSELAVKFRMPTTVALPEVGSLRC